MPAKLRPREFRIEGCTKTCSLSAEALPGRTAEMVHLWFCDGANNQLIREKLALIGPKVSNGAIGRHRANHLVPVDQLVDVTEDDEEEAEPFSDIEILERIISKGAKSLRQVTARVSPEMTMRAIEMKYKLTQGNAFQGFLDAVNEAFADEDGEPDSPDAVASEDEQAQASVAG